MVHEQGCQRVEVQVGPWLDPKLVLSSTLLQMSQLEPEQAVQAELEQNPALEVVEQDQETLKEEKKADRVPLQSGARHSYGDDWQV